MRETKERIEKMVVKMNFMFDSWKYKTFGVYRRKLVFARMSDRRVRKG